MTRNFKSKEGGVPERMYKFREGILHNFKRKKGERVLRHYFSVGRKKKYMYSIPMRTKTPDHDAKRSFQEKKKNWFPYNFHLPYILTYPYIHMYTHINVNFDISEINFLNSIVLCWNINYNPQTTYGSTWQHSYLPPETFVVPFFFSRVAKERTFPAHS